MKDILKTIILLVNSKDIMRIKLLNLYFNFSTNGKEANAILYHPNGNIASKGKYVNQKKEGKWQFFSEMTKDYLISEDIYSGDLRNGLSVKFYPDSTVAEKVRYVNDIKQGEWTSTIRMDPSA